MGGLLFFLGSGRALSFLVLTKQPGPRGTYIILLASLLAGVPSWSAFLLWSSPILYGLALLLFGLSIGAVYVTALRLAVRVERGRGLRAGLFESLIGMGALISPVGSGLFADVKLEWAYLSNLLLLLSALGILAALHSRTSERTPVRSGRLA